MPSRCVRNAPAESRSTTTGKLESEDILSNVISRVPDDAVASSQFRRPSIVSISSTLSLCLLRIRFARSVDKKTSRVVVRATFFGLTTNDELVQPRIADRAL